MKLSENTMNVLKNFSGINSGMVFRKGNVVRTISKQQNILAKAIIDENLGDDFAIYDLNRFLSLLGSLKDPELKINSSSKNIKVTSGTGNTLYGLSDESLVVAPPAKELKVDNAEVSFTLTKDDFAQVMKLAGVLSLPNIAVRGNRKKISIAALDVKNQDSDVFWIDVGNTKAEFQMVFLTENFKMIPGNYDVSISSKGISHFKNTSAPLEYWIATETGSSYTE